MNFSESPQIETPGVTENTPKDINEISPVDSPIDFYKALESAVLEENNSSVYEQSRVIISQMTPDEQIAYIQSLLKIGIFYSRKEKQHFRVLGVDDLNPNEFDIINDIFGEGNTNIPTIKYTIASSSIENPDFSPTLQGTRITGINDAIFVRGTNQTYTANELSHIAFIHSHFSGDDKIYVEIAQNPTDFFQRHNIPARDLIEVSEFLSDVCSLNSYVIPQNETDINPERIIEIQREVGRILQIGVMHNSGMSFHLPNYALSGKIMIEIIKDILIGRGFEEEDALKLLGITESTQDEKIRILNNYGFSGNFTIQELRTIQQKYQEYGVKSQGLVDDYIQSI